MQREVVGGNIAFPFSKARQLLDFYAEYEASAPDELFLCMGLQNSPEGQAVSFNACYSGPSREAERVFAQGPRRRRHAAARHAAHDRLRRAAALGRRRRSARRRLVHEVRVLGGPEARLHRRDLGRLRRAAGRQLRVLPLPLRRRDQPRGRRRDGVPASRDHADTAARRELADRRAIRRAQVAWLRQYWASVEPHMQGFYTNDIIDETQKQVDENYLGNYCAARGAEEPVRPDESVPAERERHPERVARTAKRAPRKGDGFIFCAAEGGSAFRRIERRRK